jgi:hypothetical protein
MVEAAFAWCWDARPYPAFPARTDVWTDGFSWRRGHWLNGRAGLSSLSEVVIDLCLRAAVEEVNAAALLGAVSGYVVDAPSDARAALEPLMAAYDFTAGERGGQIVFFHREEQEPADIALDDLAERSAGAPFAQRGDAAETPIEARVRFLDAAKDYLIAGVSARRLDRAEGGVASIDAPLVLEPEAAEQIAQALLADRRAAIETLRIELGPLHMGFEPGDRVTLAGGTDVFEIARIEDAEVRALDLHRTRSPLSASVSLGEPAAPPLPAVAPTPALSILDLPLLPSDEADERPLAAVFASPWLSAHNIYVGGARRARAAQPAIMGELLWALWPGPVDRWDDGNVVRVALYGGALASAERDAVLGGANVFAIDAGEGEWEVLQARTCALVGPSEYEFSGFLRGQLGSAHAMRAPHPVGARIVKLDQRLARVDIAAHEWGEAVAFIGPPANGLSSDTRAASLSVALPHAAARPWAPAQLRARRLLSSDDVAIDWVRCARHGDTWGAGEPPIGASSEAYLLEILDGPTVKRAVTTGSPDFLYAAADQIADFGAPPSSLRLRVAQIGADGSPGLNKELTIPL